jgi:hypothetical protein
VRVTNRFCDVSQEAQAILDGEARTAFAHVQIKPLRGGVMFKNEGGPSFIFAEIDCLQNPWMADALKDLKLSFGGTTDGLP